MPTVGNAQIEIAPSLNQSAMSRFTSTLRGRLRSLERTLRPEIGVRLNLNTAGFTQEVQRATSRRFTQQINLDLANVNRYQASVQANTRPRNQEIRLQLGNTRIYRAELQQSTTPVDQHADMNLRTWGYRAQLANMTRAVRQNVNAVLRSAGYEAHVARITRNRQLDVNVDLNNVPEVRARLQQLARDRTVDFNADYDRNRARETGQGVFRTIAGGLLSPNRAALQALRTGVPAVMSSPIGLAAIALGALFAGSFIGAVLGAGIIGTIGAAFIGLGAVALREVDRIQNHFNTMTNEISENLREAAQPLVEPLVDAMNFLSHFFEANIAPVLHEVFSQLAPVIQPLAEAMAQAARIFLMAIAGNMPQIVRFMEALAQEIPRMAEALSVFFEVMLEEDNMTIFILALREMAPLLRILAFLLAGTLRNSALVFFIAMQMAKRGVEAVRLVLERIIGFIQAAIPHVVQFWNQLWRGATLTINNFGGAVALVWRFLLNLGRIIFNSMLSAILSTWNFIWQSMRRQWVIFQAFMVATWTAFRTLALATWRTITRVISTSWNFIWNQMRLTWMIFQTAIVVAWNLFRQIARTIWNAIRISIQTVWNFLWNTARTIWTTFFNFIRASWNRLRAVARAIWNAIRSIIQTIWNTLWSALRRIWNVFRNFIVASWNRLRSIAQTIWNAIRQVVVTLWRTMLNVLRRLWTVFSNFIRNSWNAFLQVAQTIWQTLRRVIVNLWRLTIQRVRNLWQTFRNFIQNQFRTFLNFARTIFNRIRTTIVNLWNRLWTRVQSIWDTIRNAVESSIQTFRDNAINFFEQAAQGIRDAWEQIREWTAAPVRFVVDTVWNNGVGNLWNAAAEIFDAMPDFPEANVGFASGGIYPGYTPGRDVGLAAVSGGEAIMRPEWTRAVGADYVNTMNETARKHGASGIARQSGFARGGIVPENITDQYDKPKQGGFLDDFLPDPGDLVGIGSELLGSVGDIAREALFDNPITERLANTAESTIDNNLPSEGLGQISRYFAVGLYDQVLASIASLVAPAASAGSGGDTGIGSSQLLQAMTSFVRSAAPGARVSSGHRPGDPGYHGRQRAIDLVFSDGSQNAGAGSTPSGQAARAAQAIKSNFMGNTLELIWDPLGDQAVHNGGLHRFTGGNAGPGTHADHIHWAYGGSVDALGSAGSGDGSGFGQLSGRDVAGKDASSDDASRNDSDNPVSNMGMISAADFGSLENATGRYEHYKQKIDEAKAAAAAMSSSNAPLTNADGDVMQIAYQQAQSMGASSKVMEALFAAGFVESGFRAGASVRGVDHDSAGFLQQRPSQGWGTVSQVEDPAYATREFVSRASAIEGQHSSPGSLAQAVQRSAFPGRYAQELGRARSAIRRVSGGDFDQGGFLKPGDTHAVNKVGRPEPVLNPSQWRTMMTLAKNSEKEDPVEVSAKFYLDGREIDARIETKQEDHDKRLVRFLGV